MFKLSYDELNMMSLDRERIGGEEGELKDQPRLINIDLPYFFLCYRLG